MKKIFITILFLVFVYTVYAQDYKLFIDNNGRSTTSFASSTSYIVVKQRADSLWQMQQFDMENTILQTEVFKDRSLKIPHGKYVSYRKLNFYNNKEMKDLLKSDTVNCIMTEGEFKDGKKDGKWTDYFIGGKIHQELYYKDGLLNGPYHSYNDDQSTVALSGNYVNGKRDGEWDVLSLKGLLIEKDKYHDGKVITRKVMIHNYNAPKPPKGFETYVNQEFGKAIMQRNMKQVMIDFTVTVDGKAIKPHVSESVHDDDPILRKIFGIIESSPAWRPANTGDYTKPIEDFAMITVEINDGEVKTKVLDNATSRMLFYNLNTAK